MPTFKDAVAAVATERSYQNNLARNQVKDQRPLEQLALIDVLSQKIKQEFYDKPGQPSMDGFRKIAAVAIRCMEEHGAPDRISGDVVHDGGSYRG